MTEPARPRGPHGGEALAPTDHAPTLPLDTGAVGVIDETLGVRGE